MIVPVRCFSCGKVCEDPLFPCFLTGAIRTDRDINIARLSVTNGNPTWRSYKKTSAKVRLSINSSSRDTAAEE
jgi:hypothetical protein